MKQANLILYCGGHEVSYDQVAEVHTPAPTKTHFPLPHKMFIDNVLGSMQRNGLEVVHQAHALAGQNGERYFGLAQLEHQTTEYAVMVGFRNSHDMVFSAGLVGGSYMFVCDNLAFSGEVKVGRKHTRRIYDDLTRLINDAVGKLGGLRLFMEQRIQGYKDRQLDDLNFVDHLVVEMMRAKVISSSQIRKVLEAFEKPPHDEFTEWGDDTGWVLFNAVTEVLKGQNVFDLSRRTTTLHGLMDTACGVTLEGKFELAA